MLRKRSANWKLVVAITAACIAGVAIDHSLFYVINQNKSVGQAQKQTTNESIEAGADQTIARYTVVLALFTAVLAGVGIFQGYLTAQQIRLARDEFNASHRPKIRLKHIWQVDALEGEKRISVNIVFTNIGDARAIITEFGFDINIIRPDQRLPGNMTPSIGQEIEFPICGLGTSHETGTVFSKGTLPNKVIATVMDSQILLIVFGFLEYTDDGPIHTRKIRRTAFCRQYVPVSAIHGNGRYAMLKNPDPDYEYED